MLTKLYSRPQKSPFLTNRTSGTSLNTRMRLGKLRLVRFAQEFIRDASRLACSDFEKNRCFTILKFSHDHKIYKCDKNHCGVKFTA